MQLPPFLRGEVPGVLPQVSLWLRNLEEVEEMIARWAGDLGPEGFWWVPGPEMNPIGGLVRHIGRSSYRLFLRGTAQEIPETLRTSAHDEMSPSDRHPEEVLRETRDLLQDVRQGLAALRAADLEREASMGGARVRAAYLFDHLSTHASHHAGQIIVTRKLWNARRA